MRLQKFTRKALVVLMLSLVCFSVIEVDGRKNYSRGSQIGKTSSKRRAKVAPQSILAPMAKRINKKVHFSQMLPKAEAKDDCLTSILSKMTAPISGKTHYYALKYIPIKDSYDVISIVLIAENKSFQYDFIAYQQINKNVYYLFDKSFESVLNIGKEACRIELDYILYHYTKGTPIIDDSGTESYTALYCPTYRIDTIALDSNLIIFDKSPDEMVFELNSLDSCTRFRAINSNIPDMTINVLARINLTDYYAYLRGFSGDLFDLNREESEDEVLVTLSKAYKYDYYAHIYKSKGIAISAQYKGASTLWGKPLRDIFNSIRVCPNNIGFKNRSIPGRIRIKEDL